MAVINTNVKALFSQNALTNSGKAQSLAMQQLSTGKRINSARDDAAGMAIATRMTQQIRGLNQAVRNAGDAINLIQTAEGATNEITDMMQRMRELAIQAVNDTNDNAQRSYLDLEFQQLKQQIVQISNNTEWNGFPVLNGTAGERVGEMPVFKVTSENQFGSVFINPTTSRTLAGSDAGEMQTMTISGTPPSTTESSKLTFNVMTSGQTVTVAGLTFTAGAGGATNAQVAAAFANLNAGATSGVTTYGTFSGTLTGFSSGALSGTADVTFTSTTLGTNVTDITYSSVGATTPTAVKTEGISSSTITIQVAGVDVVLDTSAASSTSSIATQIQQTLSADQKFSASSGRSVTVSGSTLTFTYSGSDGNMDSTSFVPGAATLITSTVSTTRDAITQGSESFKANGAFLNSGALTMSANTAGAVTASFETSTGETIAMQGILNNSAVTETSAVTFNAMTTGQSITLGGLTYTATAANTAAQAAAAFAS